MMNGISRMSHKRVSIASRVMLGVATLAAAAMFFRSLPDLVRYMRFRRM
jgi:hypothetical protein